jgi:molybdate transport system substrate-binding protein
VPGIELVGPLPAELQQTGTSVAGVFSDSRHPEIARSLVAFLASPDAARVFVARGFEPAL